MALNPAEIGTLARKDLSEVDCVVLDVLRATSTMTTALAHGAAAIIPVAEIEEARRLKDASPERILAGERHGLPPEGFEKGNSPLEFLDCQGREVVLTTTNGTWAIGCCQGARSIRVGALLNLGTTAKKLASCSRVVLVAAGTFETPALEDIYAAGALVDLLASHEPTDAAITARAVYREWKNDPRGAIAKARNGRAIADRGWFDQLDWCSQISIFPFAAIVRGAMVIRELAELE